MKKTKSYIWKTMILALAIVGLAHLTSVASAEVKTLISPVVVKVNGEDISETEFLYYLIGKYGDDVIQQLVDNTILSQEADQFGLKLDPEDGWKYLRKNYSPDKLDVLGKAFDLDTVAKALARESLALQVINKKSEALVTELGLKVSDEDILKYYLDNIDKMVVPETARIAWIVLSSQDDADKALKRLDAGEDFGTVAKDMSEDDSSKNDGGEVGVVAKGETKGLPPALEDAIFALDKDEYSKVVTVGANFFIVKTLEKHDAYEPKLEDVKSLIETKLLGDKLDDPLKKWLKTLSDKSQIDVVYPIFQEMGQSTEMSGENQLP
jgi:parvulin-like peptidyl-prolyl isomerase